MIVGLGIDLVEIGRLKQSFDRFEDDFARKIFTERELEDGNARKGESRYAFFAGRWAAKESLAKALGCGFGEKCRWREIEVVNDAGGRPEMTLSGVTKETLRALGGERALLSISHEKHHACAVVILEKRS